MKSHSLLSLSAALVLCASAPVFAQFGGDDENLVLNGKFDQISADNLPEDWEVSHPNYLKEHDATVELLSEGETNYLRVVKSALSSVNIGSQEIQIPEGTTELRLAIRMRGENIIRGSDHWHLPGLSISFLYDDGTAKPGDISKWLLLPTGDSEWTEYETIMPVREEARRASVALIGHLWTGTAEFADVVVEAID